MQHQGMQRPNPAIRTVGTPACLLELHCRNEQTSLVPDGLDPGDVLEELG